MPGNYISVILLLFVPTIFSGNTRVYTSHYAALALLRCKAGNREKSRFMAPSQSSFFPLLHPFSFSFFVSFLLRPLTLRRRTTFRLFPLLFQPYLNLTHSCDPPFWKRLFLQRTTLSLSLYHLSDKSTPSGMCEIFLSPVSRLPVYLVLETSLALSWKEKMDGT